MKRYCEHNVEFGKVHFYEPRGYNSAELDKCCIHCIAHLIDRADGRGDGPLVNGLCWYARERFGPGLRW